MKTISLILSVVILIPYGFSANETNSPSMSDSIKVDCGCRGSEDGPAAKEKEGKPAEKKKSKFMVIALHVVAVAAIAGLVVLYFQEKNKKTDSIPTPQPPTEKGDYTSVTLRFTTKYKAMNNRYHVVIIINSEYPFALNYNGENYDIPAPGTGCNEAPVVYENSFERVITEPIHVYRSCQNYYIDNFQNMIYCWDFSVEPIAYTYDTSKADPGVPEIWGVDKLNFQAPPRESGCFEISDDSPKGKGVQCHSEAWLYFAKPGQAQQ